MMAPLELIERELERVRGRIAELQTEHDELEAALRVIARLTAPAAPTEPSRVFKMELHAEPVAEPPAEPECVIDISRAPVLAAALEGNAATTAPYEVPDGPGRELTIRVREEMARRGLSATACSREIFGNGSQLYQLHQGRARDSRKAEQWLAGEEPTGELPTIPDCERRVPLGDRRFKENRPDHSFEAQVERVARGEVRIAENVHIPRRGVPDGTLGGVTGEIL